MMCSCEQTKVEIGKSDKGELTHKYVYDEDMNVVNADEVTKEDRLNHSYYIKGIIISEDDTEPKEGLEEVYPVISKNRRKHFRRYPQIEGSTRTRVDTTDSHKESIIHKLAKQLLISGRVKYIGLPETKIKINDNSSISLKRGSAFNIVECHNEERLYSPIDKTKYCIVDSMAFNGKANLAVEICVTHRCEQDKANLFRTLGLSVIEVDLSYLLDDKSYDNGTLEREIIKAFRTGEHTDWVYDVSKAKAEYGFAKVVTLTKVFNRSNFVDTDGHWYMFKDIVASRLPNCPLIKGRTEFTGRDRYIAENECLKCPNFIKEYGTNSANQVLVCNQSSIDITELIKNVIGLSY